MHSTTVGIDLAKHVFQLHGVDARGRAVLSRRVKRSQLLNAVASLPPCVIGMEACGSAHDWGRVPCSYVVRRRWLMVKTDDFRGLPFLEVTTHCITNLARQLETEKGTG